MSLDKRLAAIADRVIGADGQWADLGRDELLALLRESAAEAVKALRDERVALAETGRITRDELAAILRGGVK